MDNPNPGPIYPMSKYLLFNLIQPAVQNAAWISENSACMMYTSKQFNEFIKCKKIYCLLVPRLLFAGGEAASGGGGSPPRLPPQQPPPPRCRGTRMALGGDRRHHRRGHRHCAVQVEEARCSEGISVPVGPWRRNSTGSFATKHLLVVLGQYHLQPPEIIRM